MRQPGGLALFQVRFEQISFPRRGCQSAKIPETSLHWPASNHIVCRMELPTELVTLSVQQLEELTRKLSTLRHDINGDLALVVAAAELMKLNPDLLQRMLATLMEQPPKIRDKLDRFSAEFEKTLGIVRK